MALTIHSQNSFLRGILQTGSIVDNSYYSSVSDCSNYFITTGGDLERRFGSDVDVVFTEAEEIKKIVPLGDGWVYLTESNKLKYVSNNSNGAKIIPLFDFFRITYNERLQKQSEEIIRFSSFSSPLSNVQAELSRKAFDISLLNDLILVAGSGQSRFHVTFENGVITVQPPYMATEDPVTNYVKSPFFPVEYNKVPNPFRVTADTPLFLAQNQSRVIIDNLANIKKGVCQAWIDIDPSITLSDDQLVDIDTVSLKDYLFKPIACNIIPRDLPVLSTANDYSNATVYADFKTLKNLNDNLSIHAETNLDDGQKAFLISNLLFGRKYMIIPYKIINKSGKTGLAKVSEVYNKASVTTPAVTIAKIKGVVLSEIPDPSSLYDNPDDENLPDSDKEQISILKDLQTKQGKGLVVGFNHDDGIAVNLEVVRPKPYSFSEQLSIGGTFDPDDTPIIVACGERVNNNIATTALERTPFIIISNSTRLSLNTVSTASSGGAWEMDVRNSGVSAWTTFTLDRSAIVSGVGVEFSANPTTTANSINWDGDFEMRIRYIADKRTRTGSYVEFDDAQIRPSSSKVYAKCILLEIGVPSAYSPNRGVLGSAPQNVKRLIGGNDYDGGNNVASNTMFSLTDEFSSCALTGFGAIFGAKNNIYVNYGKDLGSSNNILAYLNSQISPDYAKVAYTTTVAIDRSIFFGLTDFLNSKLPTNFPDGWQFNPTNNLILEYFNATYRNFTQTNIYRVLDNRSNVSIRGLFVAFDENAMLAQTDAGIYEVSAERVNTVLRTKENTVGRLHVFLRQMVSLTNDAHVAVSTLSFDRFGYTTQLFGRQQKPLLEGIKDSVYKDHQFLAVKEDGSMVAFTLFNNEVAGWSRMSFGDDFNADNVLIKNEEFHVLGHKTDSPNVKILLSIRKGDGSNDYVDFRGSLTVKNVESEVVFNPITLINGNPIGNLYPATIKKVRIFSSNFGQFVLVISGENMKPLTIDVTQRDVENNMILPPKHMLKLGQETFVDNLPRLHLRQVDKISGGYLHGADIEGDIGGPD